MIPGLPDWALPDSYPPPVPATPVLELGRAQELARVPPAPGYGQDWDWERFMGTGLMAGVPVTLADGRIAMPRAGGGIDVLGEPRPGLTWVPMGASGGLWIKTDPPPGVPLIQAQPNGDILVLPLTHPSVAGQAGVYTDDAQAINAAAIQAGGSYGFGGRVILGPWHYNIQSPIVIPQQSTQTGTGVGAGGPVSLVGVKGATVLQQNFSGICVYAHRSQGYGAQYGLTAQLPVAPVTDLLIDMTGAGPGSIGLDIGDGWGIWTDVEIVNGTSQPAVTFSSVTNFFTLPVGQSLPNGYPVMLLSGTAPTGFVFGRVYYVISSALNTFQLAATPGGALVTGSTNGAGLSVNGCVGLYAVNRLFWSEKGWYRAQLKHNAIACIIDTQVSNTDYSHEYNWFDFSIFCDTGQQGIVIASGSNLGGSKMWIQGNMSATSATGAATPPGSIAMLTLSGTNLKNGDGSRLYQGQLWAKVEGNPGNGTGTVFPYGIYSDGSGYLREVSGHIAHSLGNPNVSGQDSNMNGAEAGFRGPISGDSYLTQIYPTAAGGTSTAQPAFPGFGAGNAMKNTGPDMLVTVAGGTITSISINGQPTGAVSGTFLVPSGASLSMAGTVAPTTYQWVNLAQNAY